MFLWVEACSTTIYIYNKSPHRVLGSKTLKEDFIGRNPDIGNLHIFGCLTYSHVPLEKKKKMEPTAEKGILVGYSETSKAYRIYISALRKTIVRRDVKFKEDRAFRRSHDSPPTETKEQEASKVEEGSTDLKSSDQEEQEAPSTQEATTTSGKKRPRWLQETLKDAEKHATPKGTFKERRPLQNYSSYMALMYNIIDSEPFIFEEASK
jgi:hypothetical protein